MKLSLAIFILILGLTSFGNTAIIKGCLQSIPDVNGESRCLKCFFGMGLTSSFTCQFCKAGFSVVGGICQPNPIIQTNTAINVQGSTVSKSNPESIKQTIPIPDQIIQPISSTQSFTPNIPSDTVMNKSVTDTANSFQPTQGSITTKTEVFIPKPAPLPVPTQQVQQNYSIPLNCLSYSFITKICSKCTDNYQPDSKGVCTKIQQNKNNLNIKQNKTSDSITQSYDPNQPNNDIQPQNQDLVTNNPNLDNLNNINNDFSNFGNSNVITNNINNQVQPIAAQNKNKQPLNTNSFIPDLSQLNQPSAKLQQKIQGKPIAAPVVQSSTNSTSSQPIVHKFPKYPFCDDYENEQCFACIAGYLLNLIIEKCVPYVKPPTMNLTSSNSGSNQNKDTTPPSTPQSNCNLFSPQEQVCKQCYRNYFLNKNTKLCQIVDQLCRTYDPDTGLCLTCYANFSLSKQGKCFKG